MSEQPAAAQTVRDFITANRVGALATISRTLAGYPFGSVVPYDVDSEGRLIIFISNISEHFRNLEQDSKSSMLISDEQGSADPQPFARATVVGDFAPVPEPELPAVSAAYWQRFPESPSRALAHTFQFFRSTPVRVRWIGGFGDIRWVDAASYRQARFDPVAYAGQPINRHMNDDHKDALADFVNAQSSTPVTPADCSMVAVNQEGFSISVRSGGDLKLVRVPFKRQPENPGEVRTILIEMLRDIRSAKEG